MTDPADLVTSGRFRTQRFRLPDRVTQLVVFVALTVAFASALAVGRSGAGGSSAMLSAGGPQAFDAPMALPADGEYVRTRVLASGDLEVEHWIRSTTPIYRLTLGLPRALRSGGEGVFASSVKVHGRWCRGVRLDDSRHDEGVVPPARCLDVDGALRAFRCAGAQGLGTWSGIAGPPRST